MPSGRGGEAFFVDVAHCDLSARGEKLFGEVLSEAGGAAGDDDFELVELHGGSFLPAEAGCDASRSRLEPAAERNARSLAWKPKGRRPQWNSCPGMGVLAACCIPSTPSRSGYRETRAAKVPMPTAKKTPPNDVGRDAGRLPVMLSGMGANARDQEAAQGMGEAAPPHQQALALAGFLGGL